MNTGFTDPFCEIIKGGNVTAHPLFSTASSKSHHLQYLLVLSKTMKKMQSEEMGHSEMESRVILLKCLRF